MFLMTKYSASCMTSHEGLDKSIFRSIAQVSLYKHMFVVGATLIIQVHTVRLNIHYVMFPKG